MKKSIAILFFSIYLCSTTEAHELLKIPIVFQHFLEHQAENQGISVAAFLKMHYLQGDVKDKDYARDMQLPFKTAGEFFSSSITPFVPVIAQIHVPYLIEPNAIVWAIDQPDLVYSAYQVNIWQPPKYM